MSNGEVPTPGGKGFWGSLPGLLTGIAALVTAGGTVLGIVLTQRTDEPPPQPQPSITIPPEASPAVPAELSTPDPATASFAVPAAEAPETGCMVSANTFWLEFPGVPYGPFGGYYVAWDNAGYYVWDPAAGWLAYGIPQQPNTWMDLQASPFYLCLDTGGAVFGESVV
jgi:hypothetical protein